MKTFFIFLLAASFVLPSMVFAQEAESSVEQILEAETVTSADLGVEEPSLLPTSPFYFFKEIGRGLQRAITFNAVAKTELELKITSEKAAEAKKVAEQDSGNEQGISRALLNYQRAQDRLRVRVEGLRETSENPNVDRLLDRVAQRIIAHEKLLEGLEAKHDEQKSHIQGVRARLQETIGEIAEKDTAEKFRVRLEQAFEQGEGSTLKHLRSIEILDRLEESGQIPEQTKEEIQELRTKLSERTEEAVERFAQEGEEGAARLREAMQQIPGDLLKRTVVLEEIRARATDRAADALDEARESLDEAIEEGKDFEVEAREQIARNEERIQKIEERTKELGDQTPQAVRTLLENAKKHLEDAKAAFAEGNFHNAFGLSRAAEAITQNIFRVLDQGADVVKEVPQLFDRIHDRLRLIPLPGDKPNVRPVPPANNQVFCTQEFDPVCGVDGKTYSNRCVAENQYKVIVSHEGQCERDTPEEPLNSQSNDQGDTRATPQNRRDRESDDQKRKDNAPVPVEEEPLEIPHEDPPRERGEVGPVTVRHEIAADDVRFSPSEVRVAKGTKVQLTFNVSETNVYYGGLDFRSPTFNTPRVDPGDSITVEFTADESFEFKSYWPASGVLKATGRVIVE